MVGTPCIIFSPSQVCGDEGKLVEILPREEGGDGGTYQGRGGQCKIRDGGVREVKAG